jgi:hypothetical protein
MKKWDHFMDFEYAPRCPSQSYAQLCVQTANKYVDMYGKCENARSWSNCFSPEQSQCTLLQGQLCNQLEKEDPIIEDKPIWKEISKSGGWNERSIPRENVTIPSNAIKVRVIFEMRQSVMPWTNSNKARSVEMITIDWEHRAYFSHPFLAISGSRLFEKNEYGGMRGNKPYDYSNFKKIEYLVEDRPN